MPVSPVQSLVAFGQLQSLGIAGSTSRAVLSGGRHKKQCMGIFSSDQTSEASVGKIVPTTERPMLCFLESKCDGRLPMHSLGIYVQHLTSLAPVIPRMGEPLRARTWASQRLSVFEYGASIRGGL